MFHRFLLFLALFAIGAAAALATVFGTVRGVVHDPQHRPVAGSTVKIKSATSDWTQSVQTDQDGTFSFSSVPLGDYFVSATKQGFAEAQQAVTVVAGSSPTLHFQLKISAVNESTTVIASPREASKTWIPSRLQPW